MTILTVRDYVEARLGAHTEARASAAGSTIGTSAARVFIQDPRRIGFIIINLSINVMYVTPIGVPSSTNGIRLDANGGSLALLAHEDGEVVAWEWLGVADAAASTYLALETLIGTGP